MNRAWNVSDLKHQFDHVKENGWLPYFEEAAKKYVFTTALLLAIGSRETNLKNIVGDGGHGHGIMQIDNRSFPAWCRSKKWLDVQEGVRMGAWVLLTKLNDARSLNVPEKDLSRVAIASYNAGRPAIKAYLDHGNPDMPTTGHNYSADVLKRAEVFATLLQQT